MSERRARTAVPIPLDRHLPPAQIAAVVQAFEASGLVDDMLLWDQLSWFYPPSLWTPENSPLAAVSADAHSFPDAFTLGGYLLHAAPKMGAVVSTDAVRRGPTELMQTMLTLGDITGGRAILQVGAGEAKQTKPFGWKRSQGVKRLEDLLKIVRAYGESDGPIDYDGHYWQLKNASVGSAMAHKPAVWALGGGPRLLDLATSYADGMTYLAPQAWDVPERAAAEIAALKQDLDRKGRDPEAFDFGMWASVLIHEDADLITHTMANPLMRWMAAIWGRVNLRDWKPLGVESALPEDYHYAMDLLPLEVTAEEAQRVIDRVSPKQQRLSWIHGSPKEVGALLIDYVEAGVTWIAVADVLPMVVPPEDPATSLQRTLDVCAALR